MLSSLGQTSPFSSFFQSWLSCVGSVVQRKRPADMSKLFKGIHRLQLTGVSPLPPPLTSQTQTQTEQTMEAELLYLVVLVS